MILIQPIDSALSLLFQRGMSMRFIAKTQNKCTTLQNSFGVVRVGALLLPFAAMRARSSSLFQPPNPPTYHKVDQCIRFEQIVDGQTRAYNEIIIWLYTETGGRIPAIFFRRKKAELTVLISHSNDEDLGISCTYAKRLCDNCRVNVMCYEYSGYGISSGTPSEKNFYADIRAAYNYLVGDEDLIPEQIILLGRSLGSGPACELATKTTVKALILVSPILSVLRLEKSIKSGAKRFLGTKDTFENIAKIGEIGCPILLVHGKNDRRVPTDQIIELWQKTLNPIPPLYTDGGHDNAESINYGKVFKRYQEFFDSLECPVMDNIPKTKSSKNRLLETVPLMRSRVSDLMETPASSHFQSMASMDRISRGGPKRKKTSFFTTRKSFSRLQQVASIEVISSESIRSGSNSSTQSPTPQFRALGTPQVEEK